MLVKSLSPKYLDAVSFSTAEASSLKRLGEYRGRQDLFRQRAPEVLRSLQQVAIIESAESSNRLEGITAPRERVEALVLRPAVPAGRSEQEIAGYRDALNLIHESASEMAFSVNVILQLHGMLYRFLPGGGGRWKMAPNEIVERNADGSIHRVRFTPVAPVATPQGMDDLVASFARAVDQDREPLVVVPLAVLDFLCIHPFTDGNGRMARLLTLLLLYHFDFAVGRYISLERVIEGSKETYYEALEASSRRWHEGRHDSHPWLSYFWGVLIAAYKEFEERVGALRDAPGAKTALIEQAVRRRARPFAISDIEAECPGVSRDMVRHVLRQMRGRGEIEIRGRGRAAKWARRPG
ncbi:MAG TPA: Fic family protein [Gemmatimonadales bacterium]|jgi:Fic family protein|nr:Fic family protein [Gemmatimonadales bacterium]